MFLCFYFCQCRRSLNKVCSCLDGKRSENNVGIFSLHCSSPFYLCNPTPNGSGGDHGRTHETVFEERRRQTAVDTRVGGGIPSLFALTERDSPTF